jgi:polyhydroxyalkanoate synthase subunit PhaE
MSDAKTPPDWSKDWQALQKQYWNAWTDATKSATAAPDMSTPWHEGMEQWSRLFGSGKQSDAAERVMSSAKGYIAMMQSMLSAAGTNPGDAGTAHAWTEALRGGFNMPGLDPKMFDNPMAKALRDISGQGVKSFEQLSSGAMPWLQQMKSEGMSWLQAPAFGYAREHQEHYQKMAVAFAEYQEATKHYNAMILKSSQRGFEILEDKLAERSEPGRQLDSVRALYDLWVDSAEEAYAQIALTDEFRKVYGDVVNAQMRVRSQMQQEVERIGVDLGMPTRTELNSVHKRMHELRRELHRAKDAAQEGGTNDRDAQIAALREEVEALKNQLAKPKTDSTPAAPRVRPSKRAANRSAGAAIATPSVSRVEEPQFASFGDAITAMRTQLGKNKPAKKRVRRSDETPGDPS